MREHQEWWEILANLLGNLTKLSQSAQNFLAPWKQFLRSFANCFKLFANLEDFWKSFHVARDFGQKIILFSTSIICPKLSVSIQIPNLSKKFPSSGVFQSAQKIGQKLLPGYFSSILKKSSQEFFEHHDWFQTKFFEQKRIFFQPLKKKFLKLSGSIEIPKLPKTFQTSWENFHQEFLQSTPKQNWAEWEIVFGKFPYTAQNFLCCLEILSMWMVQHSIKLTPPYYLIYPLLCQQHMG